MMGGAGALLLLVVPLIFLANVNLMLFPGRWLEVSGFLSALFLPNVLPRFLHFILASVAVTSLFLAGWFCRQRFPFEERFPGLDRCEIRRELLSAAFGATVLQLVAGPLVLATLPSDGLSWWMVLNLGVGVVFGLTAMVLLWNEARSTAPLSIRYWSVVGALAVTVVMMAFARHLYREEAIAPHLSLIHISEPTRLVHSSRMPSSA